MMTTTIRRPSLLPVAMLALAAALGGCTLGPAYRVPETAPPPAAYKEAAAGWVPATPGDAVERGPWWTMFRDPGLDALVSRVEVSNQNVAAATAAYAQARALVREQRAALFPAVALSGGASRNRQSSSYQTAIGASWEPDVWGRLQGAVQAGAANAQASAADLASARLAAQGELAANYFSLRQVDTQKALVDATLAGFERSLQIARNRYAASVAPKADVLQAESQLASTRAEAIGLNLQRAQLEHAIAVLVGESPSQFSLPAVSPGVPPVPEVPAQLPSQLLQRRPDIAAAERRVAVANEQIGIERSAYFPSFALNASRGFGASRVADLFEAGSGLWSVGVSVAQTVFNAGQTRARVDGAQAAWEEAVARYRQTVLLAFQDVEDQLALIRILAEQQVQREQATRFADEAEQQVLNRYRAGQVGFAEVIAAQSTALNARRAQSQATGDRLVAAVALVQALGGNWTPP
jgi:NodT family efflux transporter outer membrane factor (OMF) lipoprotein